MNNSFAFQVVLDQPYAKALELVSAALKEEGFGVLTQIDVKKTFKKRWTWILNLMPFWALAIRSGPSSWRVIARTFSACNITVQ